jgi:hypothetical protein
MYFLNRFEKGSQIKINPDLKPNVLKHYSNFNLLELEEIYIVLSVHNYGSIKLVGFEKKFFHSDIFIYA